MYDEEKSGSIEVHKTTKGMINIEGIKFILDGVSDSGTDVHVEAITDKDGKATFNGVPIGTYTITEDGKSVPAAYFVADAQTVIVFESTDFKHNFRKQEKA